MTLYPQLNIGNGNIVASTFLGFNQKGQVTAFTNSSPITFNDKRLGPVVIPAKRQDGDPNWITTNDEFIVNAEWIEMTSGAKLQIDSSISLEIIGNCHFNLETTENGFIRPSTNNEECLVKTKVHVPFIVNPIGFEQKAEL